MADDLKEAGKSWVDAHRYPIMFGGLVAVAILVVLLLVKVF